ncbi:serine hydrolase [Mycolicibacterium sp. CBMA 295]|uniref:serine hydrolase domain-containing protein n=1 Tax=Mycolicibacterium sp. CBMA 295 TaxID=2606605 RepID=UPI001390A3C7|nr:serine hydrolase domain-containing protein [Mycolicibacterium sp. CBMA 295]
MAAAILPRRYSRGDSAPPANSSAAPAPTVAAPAPGGGLPLPTTLSADASPEFRAVAEALIDAMRTNRIPGTALGILSGDREEHAAFGVASANSMVPVSDETLFQIGSLTKTYTATAIWRLIEQGAISADAPVRTYLPDLRLADAATASAVTINNLLDHSGGWWGDEGTYTGDDDDAIARFAAERLPQLPQVFPLGKFFSYNNSGFILLGRVIEAVTGSTYHAAMDDLVFGPLGLTNSFFDRSKVLQRRYADGHYAGPINGADGVAVQTPLWLPRSADPAGGIWATTHDVLRYARIHLGDAIDGGPSFLSSETLGSMQEPVKGVPGLPVSIGRNWFVQDIGGVRIIIHNGDTIAQHTVFIAIPEKQFALVLLTNSLTGGAAAELAAIDAALSRYFGTAPLAGKVGLARVALAPPDASTVTLPGAELADYTGRFADPGIASTFAIRNDALTVMSETLVVPNTIQAAVGPPPPKEPLPLSFLARDAGVAGGALVPFVRDESGRVGWVSGGLRLVPRAKST